MDTTILLVITLVFVVLAVVILSGKGDWLIAGYNTAKEEDRKKFNVKRLRVVLAVLLLFAVAFVWYVNWLNDTVAIMLGAVPVFLIGNIAGIIIANTWCLKK
jgi:hypothetical protein